MSRNSNTIGMCRLINKLIRPAPSSGGPVEQKRLLPSQVAHDRHLQMRRGALVELVHRTVSAIDKAGHTGICTLGDGQCRERDRLERDCLVCCHPARYCAGMDDGEPLSLAAAAHQLGISELRLHQLIEQGAIRATLYLGRARVRLEEIDRYLRTQT